MSLVKSLKEIENKYSWSMLGFVIALIFGSITIYTEFIKENKPNLHFIEKTNNTVFDIKEKVGELEILYQGESLKKKNKDLKIITIEVKNIGDDVILQDFYDDDNLLGFKIKNGKMADMPIVTETSNTYLKSALKVNKISDKKVQFNKVIIEANEYFRIKLLILHEISKTPKIIPIGKIANIKEITITKDNVSENKDSLIMLSIKGDFYVQIIRLTIYGILTLLFVVMFIILEENIYKFKRKNRKQKKIAVFKKFLGNKITENDSIYIDSYLNDRYYSTIVNEHSLFILKDKYILKTLTSLYNDYVDKYKIDKKKLKEIYKKDKKKKALKLNEHYQQFKELIEVGMITIKDDDYTIDEKLLNNFEEFVKFLYQKSR